jgi:hypothetical protein
MVKVGGVLVRAVLLFSTIAVLLDTINEYPAA